MEINPKYDIGQVVWTDRLVSIFTHVKFAKEKAKFSIEDMSLDVQNVKVLERNIGAVRKNML